MRDHPQQRALARAARSHDGDHVAAMHGEINALEDGAVPVRLPDAGATDEGPGVVRRRARGLGSDQLDEVDARGRGRVGGSRGGGHRRGPRLRLGLTKAEPEEAAERVIAPRSPPPVHVGAHPPLEQELDTRDQGGDGQVHQPGRREDREELEILGHDLLAP